MLFLAIGHAFTLIDFEVHWVVFFLFPSVAVHASVLQVAAISVRLSLLFLIPETTPLLRRVIENVRLTSEVLPVVGVLALVALVSFDFVIERAPNGFEVEHVEVIVVLHVVQQVDRKFIFVVSERAEIAEIARIHGEGPLFAELRLVLLGVIKRFDSVVCL